MASAKILIRNPQGDLVPFDREKLIRSLIRSQAEKSTIELVANEVEKNLRPEMSTHEIFRLAFTKLKLLSHPHAARYKLKHAIYELGPTGFPFEKFIAAIFSYEGYEVKTNQHIPGNCVEHEVDVVAENDAELNMMECKFHGSSLTVCDVKTSLYVSARFTDIGKAGSSNAGKKIFKGWLITNTRMTEDAVRFGNCAGLQLMSWNYPEGKSLKEKIDRSGLHPVTSLTTLNKAEKQALLDNGIVLCKQVSDNPQMLNKTGISSSRVMKIIAEAKHLCNG